LWGVEELLDGLNDRELRFVPPLKRKAWADSALRESAHANTARAIRRAEAAAPRRVFLFEPCPISNSQASG
jgi:hypothetical protein